MNILFFLTPKSEIAYIYNDDTLRQALEKMEYHTYTALPMINHRGEYVGTITEGDLLWAIKNKYNLNFYEAERFPITSVERHTDNEPVSINSNIEDLVTKAMSQNFVPVIDDKNIFIGIITRKDIIQFYYNAYKKSHS